MTGNHIGINGGYVVNDKFYICTEEALSIIHQAEGLQDLGNPVLGRDIVIGFLTYIRKYRYHLIDIRNPKFCECSGDVLGNILKVKVFHRQQLRSILSSCCAEIYDPLDYEPPEYIEEEEEEGEEEEEEEEEEGEEEEGEEEMIAEG